MALPLRSRRRPATALPHTKPSAAEPVVNDAALNWTRDLSLSVEYRPIAELRPAARNARTHSKKQLHQIAASIRQFGFTTPVLVDESGRIMAGHGRVEAAKTLGLDRVPTIRLDHMSEAQKRAYAILDNRLAELAGWDRDLLAIEFTELSALDIDFDLEITGFETAEIDLLIDGSGLGANDDPADDVPEESDRLVSRPGDLWILGDHRLLCGNALEPGAYRRLMGEERARLVFTDAPYNVPIQGHVCGSGRIRHAEFAMASGEMSEAEFTRFLTQALGNMAAVSLDGAVIYACMDFRHAFELLQASRQCRLRYLNLCVWNKNNGGMGSFYRSQHELVFVFKKGTAPHLNTIELGRYGRYRTNVWEYAGVNSFRSGRLRSCRCIPPSSPWPWSRMP
jgi:ParB-like chromosome segregation protein Spo0J